MLVLGTETYTDEDDVFMTLPAKLNYKKAANIFSVFRKKKGNSGK